MSKGSDRIPPSYGAGGGLGPSGGGPGLSGGGPGPGSIGAGPGPGPSLGGPGTSLGGPGPGSIGTSPGLGPSGTGPSGSGPSGAEPSGAGPSGAGPSGSGPFGTDSDIYDNPDYGGMNVGNGVCETQLVQEPISCDPNQLKWQYSESANVCIGFPCGGIEPSFRSKQECESKCLGKLSNNYYTS